MSQYVRVRIQSVHPDHLILQLPDDSTVSWPLSGDSTTESYTAGQEMILTLTSSTNIINELLTQTDEQTEA